MFSLLHTLVALTLIFSLTVCSAGSALAADNPPDFVAIDAYVEAQMQDIGLPGLALGIIKDDQVDILLLPCKDWASVKIQHAQIATFRAIENGVSLVRPSLSGLSTAVDPQGRILAQVDAFTTAQAGPTLVAMVATHGTPTLYARIGDSFAYLCLVGLVALALLAHLRRTAETPVVTELQPMLTP